MVISVQNEIWFSLKNLSIIIPTKMYTKICSIKTKFKNKLETKKIEDHTRHKNFKDIKKICTKRTVNWAMWTDVQCLIILIHKSIKIKHRTKI